MDWKKVGDVVSKTAPLLGGLLGGPPGAALGQVVASVLGTDATPESVMRAIDTDPATLVKLAELEKDRQVELTRLHLEAETKRLADQVHQVQAVNATMQAEAKSEHWPQWSWRPYNGFMFGTSMFGVYFVLPFADVAVPDVPEMAWVMWGAVLGVTAWGRGRLKQVLAGDQRAGLVETVAGSLRR